MQMMLFVLYVLRVYRFRNRIFSYPTTFSQNDRCLLILSTEVDRVLGRLAPPPASPEPPSHMEHSGESDKSGCISSMRLPSTVSLESDLFWGRFLLSGVMAGRLELPDATAATAEFMRAALAGLRISRLPLGAEAVQWCLPLCLPGLTSSVAASLQCRTFSNFPPFSGCSEAPPISKTILLPDPRKFGRKSCFFLPHLRQHPVDSACLSCPVFIEGMSLPSLLALIDIFSDRPIFTDDEIAHCHRAIIFKCTVHLMLLHNLNVFSHVTDESGLIMHVNVSAQNKLEIIFSNFFRHFCRSVEARGGSTKRCVILARFL
jgi:hypothetical protein